MASSYVFSSSAAILAHLGQADVSPAIALRDQVDEEGHSSQEGEQYAKREVPGSPANAPSPVTWLTISPCCGLARVSVVIG